MLMLQMAAEKSELLRDGSSLRSKLVAEKQHAAVLQVMPSWHTRQSSSCATTATFVQGCLVV